MEKVALAIINEEQCKVITMLVLGQNDLDMKTRNSDGLVDS